ncbi:ligand-effect modulator 3 family [Kockovaella imperatae]|uniref:Ligand-effect modulator 3 family n=1 Tax=Kockovaella imperatae TaxID=4999 RepID=A0A1Y1UGL7_9TREE|nr:ligand-effect modulator 3 family [Kockovaella imperatae]ORX37203.1 ligand-effect modulator 3 family [Kockovaella imperatae]
MPLINRKQKDKAVDEGGDHAKKDKVKFSKRPANTAFKQQRLKAWQPILTPKAVLPTLFLIGIIFAPIGALIVWGSGKVTSITLDYTECDSQAPTDGQFQSLPGDKYDYDLATSSSVSSSSITAPTWSFSNDSSRAVGERARCEIEFEVPYDLGKGVFLYYKLTNYYQNHRRYVQSVDTSQLRGSAQSASTLDGGDCKPITSQNGKPYYPCGLIANSVFNDTYPQVVLLNPSNGDSNQTYNFTDKGIVWSGTSKNYVSSPGYPSPTDALPPPNWAERYPNGYTDETGFPDLASDEHFQVWMRIAAFPTFRKLWARNDDEIMSSGRYRITIYMNYPVKQFSGTKSVVISTVSWIGGKQPFLGWAYIAAAILCVVLAIAGLLRHLIKPRKLGDMSCKSRCLHDAQC